jgi:hypothetical protein
MLRQRRIASRARPAGARLISAVFPRYYLLLTTGDRLLLNNGGGRLILENPPAIGSTIIRQRNGHSVRDRAGNTIRIRS